MKVATTIREAHSLDARNRDAARSAADQSDGKAQPFDDVLSDVGTDGKAAADGAASPDKTAVKATSDDTTASLLPAEPANAAADPASLSALIDAFGKAAAAPVAADAASGKAAANAMSVGKRTTKDSGASADTSAPQSTTPTTGSDIMAMLMAGAGAVAQTQTTASASDTTHTPKSSATAGIAATATAEGPSETAGEVIVSDISVSTHLAPVSNSLNVAASQDRAAAKPTAAVLPEVPKPEMEAPLTASTDSPRKSASGTEALDASAIPVGASLGPTHTIAKAIGELAAAPAAPTTSAASDVTKPFVSVARTLNLKMSPESLGTVDIRLHVTGQSLDVQLTVSNEQTLGIVSRDRDVLASALRDQDYQVNSLVIQDGGAGASSGGNNATQNGQSSGGGPRPDSSFGGGASARGERQEQGARQSGSDSRRTPTTPASPASDESGRALFV